MLILRSDIAEVTGLAFSPDGLSLVAAGHLCVQVWPQWLAGEPRPVARNLNDLERYAFTADGSRILIYLSGNSRTRALGVPGNQTRSFPVPTGPAWFHFTTAGGYAIVSHDRGKLTRFDLTPDGPKAVARRWTIKRKDRSSYYRFGFVCGPAGTFVSVEYLFGDHGPGHRTAGEDRLVVRSVEDGSVIHTEDLGGRAEELINGETGLLVALHPAGTCLAFPAGNRIRLWPLADGVEVPETVGGRRRSPVSAVAFHPGAQYLAAAGNDGTVKLYDTVTWGESRAMAWGVGRLLSVCFSPDGTRAAAGSARGQIVVWDVDL